MRKTLVPAVLCALFAYSAFAADDVASAVVGTVKAVDKATKTAVVKTGESTEHTFKFVGRTVAHGAEATARGSRTRPLTMKEGDEVIVHYTVKARKRPRKRSTTLARMA